MFLSSRTGCALLCPLLPEDLDKDHCLCRKAMISLMNFPERLAGEKVIILLHFYGTYKATNMIYYYS